MKRLVPYWIAAVAGFVLIVSHFIPDSQGWGEVAAIWFDILQAIAFILGGGNLIKIHLKKASDRPAGWGYSVVVLVSFLTVLSVGLLKVGVPPAPIQEYYGESFAPLPLASIPASQVFTVPGSIPEKVSFLRFRQVRAKVHASVRAQLREEGGQITFRGWMRGNQRTQLLGYKEQLAWQCNIENLFDASQAKDELAGRIQYYVDHSVLSFKGHMNEEQRDALLAFDGDASWEAAVNELYDKSQATTDVRVDEVPPLFDPDALPANVSYDAGTLSVRGPMNAGQRGQLVGLFPTARPVDGSARTALLDELRALGPVETEQVAAFDRLLDGLWSVESLTHVLDEAAKAQEEDKTACEMLDEQVAGVTDIDPQKMPGDGRTLNRAQVAALGRFAEDESLTIGGLVAMLREAGDLSGAQERALRRFLGPVPTAGTLRKSLCFAMMKVDDFEGRRLTLNEGQHDLLLADYRAQAAWRHAMRGLMRRAHTVKFPWSGEYNAQGAPFWWLYEYMFKPLQATIFAMLAFYVASAAFRAFRAKNIEAILLLSTAFIILLGRTFAGVWMTSWIADDSAFAGLKVENLSMYIMQVFNTAGNRAIMIGIALGITSTSLKVLLGVDRSYLGSAQE